MSLHGMLPLVGWSKIETRVLRCRRFTAQWYRGLIPHRRQIAVVHAILEQPSPPRFVLTGSSARKLRRGGVDLLGGRAEHRTMHPFMVSELPGFDLDRALRIGSLPLVMNAADPANVLDAYASLYLEEEVRAEGLTRNVGAFTRFLEAISFSHGRQLNVSAVARECVVERMVVAG